MKKTVAYVGIDLAIAKSKYLPVCICVKQCNQLRPFFLRSSKYPKPPKGIGNVAALKQYNIEDFADRAVTYIEKISDIENLQIQCIAIDAPHSFKQSDSDRRNCEKAMDAKGISCFATPSLREFETIIETGKSHLENGGKASKLPNANRIWMLVGFKLFEKLSNYNCIEVFPQAIVAYLNVSKIHKSKKKGLTIQLNAIAKYTKWPTGKPKVNELKKIGFGTNDDKLDAYMSAWIASLPDDKRTACGTPPHDAIWIPSTIFL